MKYLLTKLSRSFAVFEDCCRRILGQELRSSAVTRLQYLSKQTNKLGHLYSGQNRRNVTAAAAQRGVCLTAFSVDILRRAEQFRQRNCGLRADQIFMISEHLFPARDHDPHYRPLDQLCCWHGVRGKLGARLMARITTRCDISRHRRRGSPGCVRLVSLIDAGCAGPSYPRPLELSNFHHTLCTCVSSLTDNFN